MGFTVAQYNRSKYLVCIQLRFYVCCAVKSKLKIRTEFSNVWGEYKNHSNPYIQGTTVPCDNFGQSIAKCSTPQN